MKRITKFNFCITAIIIISILFCLTNSFAEKLQAPEEMVIQIKNGVITEHRTEEAEDFLWKTLMHYFDDNELIVAGVMGYFQRESQMRSDAIAGWATRDMQSGLDTSQEFTNEIDAGLKEGTTKEQFIDQVHIQLGGYGLGQWVGLTYLSDFYDFAQKWGGSIADAEMQCAFMRYSLEYHTPELWQLIQEEDNAYIIGRKIGYLYDGTHELGAETIASYAQEYYKEYGTR